MSCSRFARFTGRVYNTYVKTFFLESEGDPYYFTKPSIVIGCSVAGSLASMYIFNEQGNGYTHKSSKLDLMGYGATGAVFGFVGGLAVPYVLPFAIPLYIGATAVDYATTYKIVKTK